MNTWKFEITVGINPGYFHNNEANKETFGEKLLDILHEVDLEVGVFVNCNFHFQKTLYSSKHGCPKEGEDTILIHGIMHPEFCKEVSWKYAISTLAKKLIDKFDQTTLYLTFHEVDFYYCKKKNLGHYL